MKTILTFIMESFVGRILSHVGRNLLESARIEGLKLYLNGVAAARRLFLLVLALAGSLLLFFFGFLLLHAGLLVLLQWSLKATALLAAGLGLFYLLVAGGFLFYVCRERTWMKASGADKALHSVLGRKTL